VQPAAPLLLPVPKDKVMTALKRSARRVRWELRLGLDRIVDWLYSIDTVVAGPLPRAKESSRFDDAYVNGPVSYLILRSYLDCRKFGPREVFYDIGCGHGRVLCMVARHRVAKSIGIELSTEFAEKARANAAALRGRVSPIEVRVGDAAEMDYTDGTTFYFGDPFGANTMRAVLKRIGETVAAKPRAVRCIFILPMAERSDAVRRVIETSGWLRFVGEQSLSYSPMRVEYWAWGPNQNGDA
jgi:SAM-dependent methyltransferase